MGHNLNVANGKVAMAYTGETPWHKLGMKVEGAMTSAEALTKAGLDYAVEKRGIFYPDPKSGQLKEYKERFMNVRMDTGDGLGIVGDRYRILQNSEAFSFFDSIVGEKLAMYHTAGALGKGERIWMTAKLPGDMWITDTDNVEKFLLLTNSHDGTKAVEVLVTPIRVVCQNTLNMALGSYEGKYWSRHTLSLGSNVEEIRNELGLINRRFQIFEELSKKLVNIQANKRMVDNLLKDLKLDDESINNKRAENQKFDILKLFETGKGNAEPKVKGTAWALINGVAEYADYELTVRGKDEESRQFNRFNSIFYGAGSGLKQRALDSILTTAGIK